ncbi:MAG: GLPGLI family protein, partial [Bacteroidota bacterium]
MRLFTLFLFFLASFSLSAQVKYGTIDYVRTTEMTIGGDFENNKEIKAMIAQMSASGAFNRNYRATFGPGQFNFMELAKEETSMTKELRGGNQIKVISATRDLTGFFTDTETRKIRNTENILDRPFLVTGTLPALEWTITEEKVAPSEETVGLDLKIATAITSFGDTLRAGFAPSLPAQVGPLNYYGLPGAIITLKVQNGGTPVVYRATNLSLSDEPLEISEPSEGKAIGLEKFQKEKAKR